MILFPAIDLKDGQCVRLFKGDIKQSTIFNNDPASQAQAFEEAGCQWIHVIDLDGAFKGCSVNQSVIEKIIQKINLPIQLGGGIRDRETIEMWLTQGVRRIILGTAAVKNPAFVKEVCQAYPGRIAVGIDSRNGKVAAEGWVETSEIRTLELAKMYEEAGVSVIIYTDIERDGTLAGPNIEETLRIACSISTPVIASGGISSMDDLESLKISGNGLLEGVISGRAIYDGRIDPREAVSFLGE